MAPDLDTFAKLAEEEFDALPAVVRAVTGDLQIQVAEWPETEHLSSVGVHHPLDLLGLFEGVGLSHFGAVAYTGQFPNRIWLYRQPILAYTAEGCDSLRAVVRHVLVHEIGHHFGLSDDDMYAIDDAPDEHST